MRAREAMRLFDTTGPVRPADHHRIPPIERPGLDDTPALARMKKCFVSHAPRRKGGMADPA